MRLALLLSSFNFVFISGFFIGPQFSHFKFSKIILEYERRYEGSSTRSDFDRELMREALQLATRAKKRTFPNPAVGCIIFGTARRGVGWHPRAGYPHAEVYALADYCGILPVNSRGQDMPEISSIDASFSAKYKRKGGEMFRDLAKGTTAYVTLEPCCHSPDSNRSMGEVTKKSTPPCATTLIQAGVSRVVIGCRDPNSHVNGGGVKLLRASGITVDWIGGKEEHTARDLISSFTHRMQAPHPVSMTLNVRAKLRQIAHKLKVSRQLQDILLSKVKEKAVSETWYAEADCKLTSHELLIVKGVANNSLARVIAQTLRATEIQVIGNTCLLFRPSIAGLKTSGVILNGTSLSNNSTTASITTTSTTSPPLSI